MLGEGEGNGASWWEGHVWAEMRRKMSNPVKHHWTNHGEMIKIQKESCVNYFASVLFGKVRKVAHTFLYKKISMTLVPRLQQRLWECSRNKINEAKVVRSLYFNAVSLVF